MKKVEVTSKGEAKRVMYFDKVTHLDVFKTDQVEELERWTYTVFVNMLKNFPFQYDSWDKCLYIDIEDVDANIEQIDKLSELTEWKNKEESKKIMEEHYIEYVKRQEVNVETWDNTDVIGMIETFISKYGI